MQAVDENEIKRAKFYSIIRSAHIERSAESSDWILYSRTNYDMDPDLLESNVRVRKVSPWQLPRFLNDNNIRILEVNEPLMLPAWPVLIPIFLLRLLHPLMRSRLRVVFYAIENLDPSVNLARRLHMPLNISRIITSLACRLAFSATNRVAFGTQGSMDLYASILGSYWQRPEILSKVRRIDPLPAPAKVSSHNKVPGSVLYLGDLSSRKGITRLMTGWDKLPKGHGLTLRVIGIGEELDKVTGWAAGKPEVSLLVDPSRSVIHETLATSETLVLLSSTSLIWREQIGLPLLEGWSYGCNLISTDATGIADLLRRSGHAVLPEDFSDDMLIAALTGSIAPRRPAQLIQQALPAVDGRRAADEWLGDISEPASDISRNTN
ncbi:glycosyltransferase [Pseudarthrobacter sulfonivorans]|uniref:glycosyltransferase n=1 Tax=Pseudarthrobacter sulfonivorans TaxID=121292 RepID=UPI00210366BB|nr:glycosyltransferase [Pseudarthrobacter sulfonivorans]